MANIVKTLLAEDIIRVIEEHPAIYDNASGVSARKDAWHKVLKKLIPYFEAKSPQQKLDLGKSTLNYYVTFQRSALTFKMVTGVEC